MSSESVSPKLSGVTAVSTAASSSGSETVVSSSVSTAVSVESLVSSEAMHNSYMAGLPNMAPSSFPQYAPWYPTLSGSRHHHGFVDESNVLGMSGPMLPSASVVAVMLNRRQVTFVRRQ